MIIISSHLIYSILLSRFIFSLGKNKLSKIWIKTPDGYKLIENISTLKSIVIHYKSYDRIYGVTFDGDLCDVQLKTRFPPTQKADFLVIYFYNNNHSI